MPTVKRSKKDDRKFKNHKIHLKNRRRPAAYRHCHAVCRCLCAAIFGISHSHYARFSDLPELLAAFAYGPLAGVAVAGIKNLIHLPLSSSMYVGELSNFLLGAVLSVAAGAIYKKHKTKRGALAAAVLSAVIMGLVSVPVNYWIIYPLYYNVLGFPQAAVLDMYRAILPATKSILQALFIFNLPFTVAKGLLCAALCAGIYKPLSPLLHGRK